MLLGGFIGTSETALEITMAQLGWVKRLLLPYQWFLLLVVFLTHGLLLLNDGLYWDSWTATYPALDEHNWTRLFEAFVIYEKVNRAYIHWVAAMFFGPIFGHKLFTFVAILVSVLCLDRILSWSQLFSPRESLIVNLIFITFPAYQVTVELIMMPYSFDYALFLLGMAGVFRLSRLPVRWAIPVRLMSWFLLLMSFWTFSLLTFHYGFLAILVAREHFVYGKKGITLLKNSVLGYLDLWVLPLLFWIYYELYFSYTDFGEVASYELRLFDPKIFSMVLNFFNYGIIAQVSTALSILVVYPVVGLVLITLGILIYRHWKDESSAGQWWIIAGLGGILLALAIYPYAAVQLYPAERGWWTRHALLLSLPLGFLAAALVRLAQRFKLSRYLGAVLAVLIMCFVIIQIDVYFSWQARWVKDRSIVEHMKAIPELKGASIVWFVDRFPVGYETRYRFNEYTGMLRSIDRELSRLGSDLQTYSSAHFALLADPDEGYKERKLVYLENLDIHGCQTLVIIEEGPAPNTYDHTWGVSLRYFAFKYILKGKMDTYLHDFTTLQVSRLPAPLATHCAYQRQYQERYSDAYLEQEATGGFRGFTTYVSAALRLMDVTLAPNIEPLEKQVTATLIKAGVENLEPPEHKLSDEQLQTLEALGVDTELYQMYRALAEYKLE